MYVLKLVEGKYYVGIASGRDDVDTRTAAHFNGQGSMFTRTYHPLHVIEVIEGGNEDDTVLEYMHKYGIDNVRGGAFSSIDIRDHMATIKKMLRSKYNLCFGCGDAGHFYHACPRRFMRVSSPAVRLYSDVANVDRAVVKTQESFDWYKFAIVVAVVAAITVVFVALDDSV